MVCDCLNPYSQFPAKEDILDQLSNKKASRKKESKGNKAKSSKKAKTNRLS